MRFDSGNHCLCTGAMGDCMMSEKPAGLFSGHILHPWLRGHGLSSTTLKIIAMLVMLLDHVTAVLLVGQESYWTLRTVGRVSFPIFCFLIAEGMFYTHDIYRYALRLGVFALLSEIPYDLAFHGTICYPDSQNVFFTLFLAVLAGALRQWGQERRRRNPKDPAAPLVVAFGWLLLLLAADFLQTDYGTNGVALILVFYLLRERGWLRYLAAAAFMWLCWHGQVQLYALCALPILMLYSGKKGAALPKYLFYAFYPLHLLILFGIRYL